MSYTWPGEEERTCPKCNNISDKPYSNTDAGFHCDTCRPPDKQVLKPRGRAEYLKMKKMEVLNGQEKRK